MMFDPSQSRKLTGLIITLAALLVLTIVATVVIVATGNTTMLTLFGTIGGYVMGVGTAHQGAQMMADRSPNYPGAPVANPSPPPPPASLPSAFPASAVGPPPPPGPRDASA